MGTSLKNVTMIPKVMSLILVKLSEFYIFLKYGDQNMMYALAPTTMTREKFKTSILRKIKIKMYF